MIWRFGRYAIELAAAFLLVLGMFNDLPGWSVGYTATMTILLALFLFLADLFLELTFLGYSIDD
jgi:hypothetical protein